MLHPADPPRPRPAAAAGAAVAGSAASRTAGCGPAAGWTAARSGGKSRSLNAEREKGSKMNIFMYHVPFFYIHIQGSKIRFESW